MRTIAIVTTGHSPYDERILDKFSKTFSNNGFKVHILCTTEDIDEYYTESIHIKGSKISNLRKISVLIKMLREAKPDIIICSEILPILSAYIYKTQDNNKTPIFYDLTEWYPENVSFKYTGFKKYLSYILLYLFQMVSIQFCSGIICGEKLKKKRMDFIASYKPKVLVPYYPRFSEFDQTSQHPDQQSITIGFTGLLSEDRGFLRVLIAANKLASKFPEYKIRLMIIGKFLTTTMEQTYITFSKDPNFRVELDFHEWTSYKNYLKQLAFAEIFIDLRNRNYIFNNSLPIKIFDYMAAGKPVIYSKLKSLDEIPVYEFGSLVDPDNEEQIIEALSMYVGNPSLLNAHGSVAKKLAEEIYNWEKCEPLLINFLNYY